MHYLYRHFDSDGRLLYVGISVSALIRLRQHKTVSHWFESIVRVEIERFPSRELAKEAEHRAIRNEKPLHNITLRNIRPIKGAVLFVKVSSRMKAHVVAAAESLGITMSDFLLTAVDERIGRLAAENKAVARALRAVA